MITIQDAFDKFKSRLELTVREQEDASRRHQEIRDYLTGKFEINRDFLTGSYARWTKTKPLKDVDIFFVLGKKERGYRDQHPSVVLEKFRDALAEKYGKDRVFLGRRSVQVDFGVQVVEDQTNDQVMSVDVVPSFAKGPHYEIPDRTTGSWVMTDPEVHAELATKANKAFSEEWKPLVKMIKKWNQAAGTPVKPGFLLEVLALDLFVPEFSGGYPYELKGFFATAADRIKGTWSDPAKLGPPVSDQMDEARASVARGTLLAAEESVTRAIRLAKEGRQGAALQEWRKLFGPLFPLS